MTARLFEDEGHWTRIHDGNPTALAIFKRHYTYNPLSRKKPKNRNRFAGPAETLILLGKDGRSLFVWRRERYRLDDQKGINCAVFRNEGTQRSSDLIREAVQIAAGKWPDEKRYFTFVNATKIKSANPGYCFKKAGWNTCGKSAKRKLIILEFVALDR